MLVSIVQPCLVFRFHKLFWLRFLSLSTTFAAFLFYDLHYHGSSLAFFIAEILISLLLPLLYGLLLKYSQSTCCSSVVSWRFHHECQCLLAGQARRFPACIGWFPTLYRRAFSRVVIALKKPDWVQIGPDLLLGRALRYPAAACQRSSSVAIQVKRGMGVQRLVAVRDEGDLSSYVCLGDLEVRRDANRSPTMMTCWMSPVN